MALDVDEVFSPRSCDRRKRARLGAGGVCTRHCRKQVLRRHALIARVAARLPSQQHTMRSSCNSSRPRRRAACQFRRRFSRSCRRAGSWDDGAGRRDLPRSASDHGAAERLRAGRIRRYCRTQSISGRARRDGADCGRADRQSIRPANHASRQPLAIYRGICCLRSSPSAFRRTVSAILIMRRDRQSRADARLCGSLVARRGGRRRSADTNDTKSTEGEVKPIREGRI